MHKPIAIICLLAGVLWAGLPDFAKLYVGTTPVRGYIGETLVWDPTPAIVYAPESDFTYTVADGKATITAYVGAGGQVNIPPTLGGNRTDAIGDWSIYGNTSITGVTFPDGLTRVGDGAFYHVTVLTSVSFSGSTVTYIGDSAFNGCTGLTTVTIPDSVGTIAQYAFVGCTSLLTVYVGSGVTTLGRLSFYNNYDMYGVYFSGDAPTIVGDQVFASGTAYYRSGAIGFSNPWQGLPTAIWASYPNRASPASLGPLAWYRADGNAGNSAAANAGTWAGAEAYAAGVIGQAFSFDGSSYINIGTPAGMMVGGDVSFSAWVKVTGLANYRSIFGAGYLAGTPGYGLFVASGGYYSQARSAATASNPGVASSSTEWIHLVGVRRGTVQELWANGVLAASETLDVGDSTPSSAFGIGSRYSAELAEWGFNFVGLIDEVLLYGRALSQSEIRLIYTYR